MINKQKAEIKKSLDRKIREENKSKVKQKAKPLEEYTNVELNTVSKWKQDRKASLGLEFKEFKPKWSKSRKSNKSKADKSPI